MRLVLFFLLLVPWLVQTLPIGAAADAAVWHGLYQRAGEAIAARDIATATQLLQQLLTEHPTAPVAEVAAFHLAECYHLSSQPREALWTLRRWGERLERTSPSRDLATDTTGRARQLLPRVLESLDESHESTALLQEVAAWQSAPSEAPQLATAVDWYRIRITLELSRRYERHGEYELAMQCLEELLRAAGTISPQEPQLASTVQRSLGLDEISRRLRVELPLAWANQCLADGQAQSAIEILNRAVQQIEEPEQELAVRFLLAEAYYAVGQTAAAAEQFQWLMEQAADSQPPPAWLAAVMLRRAELWVRSRSIADARHLLLTAKTRFPDSELDNEFDYLLARCAIARIEFAEAQQLLQQVMSAPASSGKEITARAGWLSGEIHFLQRDYQQAIAAYRVVTQLEAFPEWQARAWLQTAKCHELLDDPQAALAGYQRAAAASQQPEIMRTVTERTAIIHSSQDPKLR